ncbi:MAG: Fpg/Nei family DNA glycosylase [Prolixibacteraceae bacterium]
MPELPDVEIFRKEAEKSRNSGIRTVEVEDNGFVDLTKNDINKKLKDKKFKDSIRRGKYLFMPVDKDAAVVMHFGMTGYLKYLKESEDAPDYTKCSFVLKNKHKLHYISKRKLGHVEFTDNVGEYVKKKKLGEDALEISEEDFISRLKKKKSMIKPAITNQDTLSGIGNVYADEILFQSNIHPKKTASKLSEADLKKIYKNTQKVLKKAIEKEADVSKLPATWLLPNRDEGNNCPKCNGKVQKIKISGRTGYYCPSCQKE